MPPSCTLLGGFASVHGLRCYGNITRTRNVSQYVLVLAPYLFIIIIPRTIAVNLCCVVSRLSGGLSTTWASRARAWYDGLRAALRVLWVYLLRH